MTNAIKYIAQRGTENAMSYAIEDGESPARPLARPLARSLWKTVEPGSKGGGDGEKVPQ